jgi:hypothetical protein
MRCVLDSGHLGHLGGHLEDRVNPFARLLGYEVEL